MAGIRWMGMRSVGGWPLPKNGVFGELLLIFNQELILVERSRRVAGVVVNAYGGSTARLGDNSSRFAGRPEIQVSVADAI
ncbi:hypothetical protein [Lysobacter capsici]|uniref:hypothetical protein n=1 Tax=Lysobacter capsici TaxID=435897 RepID=UPI001BFFE830|nr:hypothetical protein [Lysobacter capsici]QWF17219.1 hypothetical protein KME82_26425 [Lysobacter capsici]